VLAGFRTKRFAWKPVLAASATLSHAEIDQACRDAIKAAILTDRLDVSAALVRQMLKERSDAHHGKRE